jgi:GntR family transcriptional regulator/MocR family aminotransferase
MRLVYEARHQLVSEILRDRFSGELQVIPSAAGLHLTAAAADTSIAGVEAIVRRAARAGVACHPLAFFYLMREPSAGLVLGYGAIPTDRIEPGLERLRAAWSG